MRPRVSTSSLLAVTPGGSRRPRLSAGPGAQPSPRDERRRAPPSWSTSALGPTAQRISRLLDRVGLGDASLYPSLLVTTAINAMRLSLSAWEATGRKLPIPVFLDEAFDTLARGLTEH